MKARAWLLAVTVICAACAGERGPAVYGEPVRFAKGREIVFPDFNVRYLGKRHVAHPTFRPGFTYEDFEVTSPRGRQTVSWSSGTGVIDAADFAVDGREYALELRATVARKGWLRDDELVIWPRERWLEVARRR